VYEICAKDIFGGTGVDLSKILGEQAKILGEKVV